MLASHRVCQLVFTVLSIQTVVLIHICLELGGSIDGERHIWGCMEHCAELLGGIRYYSHHIDVHNEWHSAIIPKFSVRSVVDCMIPPLDARFSQKVSLRF